MEKTNEKYRAYVQILKEELLPAMGCTEPIALAYAAAVARKTLGAIPDRVVIGASGSIIKNVKSVIVPNTGHLKGIPAAVTAGIIAGRPAGKGAGGDCKSYTKADHADEGVYGIYGYYSGACGSWSYL